MADVQAGDPADDVLIEPGTIIDGRWKVGKMLGEGSFGAVYEAVDTKEILNGKMALKIESANSRIQLTKIEVTVLRSLQGNQHVCTMFACGKNQQFNFVLMSLLGPSLSMLKKKVANRQFSFSTTVRTTFHCSKAIHSVHQAGWLHRDIKPSNFAIGCSPETQTSIFILDFGLCRKYRVNASPERQGAAAEGEEVRPARQTAGFRGTMRYASLNAHKKMELGRHDDLISLMYMMVEMVKGELPWRSMIDGNDVYRSKMATQTSLFDKLPKQLNVVFQYLNTLRYEIVPNYEELDGKLLEIIFTMSFQHDAFDWCSNDGPASHSKTPPSTNATSSKPSGDMLAKLEFEPDPEDQVEELPQSSFKVKQ